MRFAATLAEGLIREEGNPDNAWVTNDARAFMKGLLLYVWLTERNRPERRNLLRVRELLSSGHIEKTKSRDEDPWDALIWEMKEAPVTLDDECGGALCQAIRSGAEVMDTNQGRDGKNPPKSAALEQTSWLEFPELASISRRSDFAGEDLKTGNICLFICAPVTDIQTKLSGWVRALTMMTMYAFENMTDVHLKIPALFAIDEMPALGRIDVLATSAPVFRKHGIRLLIVAQDLQKLKKAYPQDWAGFLSNAECTIWMAAKDPETLRYLGGELLGKRTHEETVEAGGMFSNVDPRPQKVERDLMYPQQLKEFLEPSRGQIIVVRSEGAPLRLGHAPYFTELPVSAYEPDRKFGEKPGRAVGRKVIELLTLGYGRFDRLLKNLEGSIEEDLPLILSQLGLLVVAAACLFGLVALTGMKLFKLESLDLPNGVWQPNFHPYIMLVLRLVLGFIGMLCAIGFAVSILAPAYSAASTILKRESHRGMHFPYHDATIKAFAILLCVWALALSAGGVARLASNATFEPIKWILTIVVFMMVVPLLTTFGLLVRWAIVRNQKKGEYLPTFPPARWVALYFYFLGVLVFLEFSLAVAVGPFLCGISVVLLLPLMWLKEVSEERLRKLADALPEDNRLRKVILRRVPGARRATGRGTRAVDA